MKKIMIILVIVLALASMIGGCGKGGKKYIGTYISKDGGSTIEIRKDGTWQGKNPDGRIWTTNETYEWEIDKDGRIVLYLGSIGSGTYIGGELKGNTLIDRYAGRGSFIRQD